MTGRDSAGEQAGGEDPVTGAAQAPGRASAPPLLTLTCGWAITAADEKAIALLPAGARKPGVDQDGHPEEDKHVAGVTHLMSRAGNRAEGLRWIVRRARPSRRQSDSSIDLGQVTVPRRAWRTDSGTLRPVLIS
jgi:hypothetical protein